uniref:Uncharacterized protein n=1 Tax=Rhizophora mucronata TaxID=61149 RepID=A0A2P2Q926_RHIMU
MVYISKAFIILLRNICRLSLRDCLCASFMFSDIYFVSGNGLLVKRENVHIEVAIPSEHFLLLY